MNPYSSLCDDFYIHMNLSTEMDLPQNRETVLHYLERVRRQYPTMRNFYAREKGDFILEEDKDKGTYRWTTIEPRRICSGVVNPETVESAIDQHRLVLDIAPTYLSVSTLDCEALDLLFGFDMTFSGNQNKLVAEALGVSPALEPFVQIPGATVINQEPSLTLALDESCRIQCRVSVETRTNAYQVRTNNFPEDQISVYFTARQYGSLDPDSNYLETLDTLTRISHEMIDKYVVENVLQPLHRAIATR